MASFKAFRREDGVLVVTIHARLREAKLLREIADQMLLPPKSVRTYVGSLTTTVEIRYPPSPKLPKED